MIGILYSDEKKALKNRRKVENKILDLIKCLEKFSVTNQSDEEKLEIYGIMSEIEELDSMISIY